MNRLVLFVLLSGFWVLLTWPANLGAAYAQDLGVGLAVAILITAVVGEDRGTVSAWLEPQRYVWTLIFLCVLTASIVKANLEVTYRVLHPRLPIRPGIVRVKTRLRGPAARTLLGNSITLCPGTLSVDIWDDGTLMVHWINVGSLDEAEAGRQILGRFEWFIAKIFE